MTDATQTTDTSPGSDPTLSTLIPQPSLRRNLLLASAAILLLVGAWASPQVLRPSVFHGGASGMELELARQHQVLTTVSLAPYGWPSVGVHSVSDLAGAKVAGAWVIAGPFAKIGATTDPVDYTTGLDYLRATFPHGKFDAASALPQRLDQGESAQLFILWDITDCSRLVEGQVPQIELKSVLGSTQEELPWSSPAFGRDKLTENGTCPAP